MNTKVNQEGRNEVLRRVVYLALFISNHNQIGCLARLNINTLWFIVNGGNCILELNETKRPKIKSGSSFARKGKPTKVFCGC